MITCDFENRGSLSLCEYLTAAIRRSIRDGTVKPNEKLPSKRALAEHLGISVITVANAYAELIDEGYVTSIEKRGFFAADVLAFSARTARSVPAERASSAEDASLCTERTVCTDADSSVSGAGSDVVRIASNRTDAWSGECTVRAEQEWFADFRANSTSYEKFPFSLWSKVMRSVLQRPHESLLRSSPPEGVENLRISIARYLHHFRGMNVDPSCIVIGAGTEYLYSLVVQLLGRDTVYVVENPGYRKLANVLAANGAQCAPIAIDAYGIVPQLLEAAHASVVHISPSHHFPTGIVMPVRRRQELLAWAAEGSKNECGENGRYIIEDDYDSEFRFTGKPLATLQSADGAGRVIYINTFSKTLSPSYRISYMVLPPAVAVLFRRKIGFYSSTVSAFEQYALARFMDEGHFEKHLIRMKNYYRTLRNELTGAIRSSPFASRAHILEKDAGLHFLLKIDSPLEPQELQRRLAQKSVNMPLLSEYYYGDAPECDSHTFVLNYSGIKKERIGAIIERIGEVLGV